LGCARDQVLGHFALSLGYDAITSRHGKIWLTVDSCCQVLSCARAEDRAFFHCIRPDRVLGSAAEGPHAAVDRHPRESARERDEAHGSGQIDVVSFLSVADSNIGIQVDYLLCIPARTP
jgi:hypothetical protein